MFRTHFIVVYNAGPWEAMEASRKIVMKNFFPLLSLVVILVLIVIVSILPLLLGLFFSLPLSITAIYCAFAQITNCEYVEEEIRKDSDSNLFPTY